MFVESDNGVDATMSDEDWLNSFGLNLMTAISSLLDRSARPSGWAQTGLAAQVEAATGTPAADVPAWLIDGRNHHGHHPANVPTALSKRMLVTFGEPSISADRMTEGPTSRATTAATCET